MERANKCTRQMLKRFLSALGLLQITLPFDEVQHLFPFGIVMGPHYFFHFKIFEELIAFHIIANLMGYAKSIDIFRVCDCNEFIAKFTDRCASRLNQRCIEYVMYPPKFWQFRLHRLSPYLTSLTTLKGSNSLASSFFAVRCVLMSLPFSMIRSINPGLIN